MPPKTRKELADKVTVYESGIKTARETAIPDPSDGYYFSEINNWLASIKSTIDQTLSDEADKGLSSYTLTSPVFVNPGNVKEKDQTKPYRRVYYGKLFYDYLLEIVDIPTELATHFGIDICDNPITYADDKQPITIVSIGVPSDIGVPVYDANGNILPDVECRPEPKIPENVTFQYQFSW